MSFIGAVLVSIPITIVICAIIYMMDDVINPNKED